MDVVITGASRGIGRALALALTKERPADRLVLVARDRERLEALAAEIDGAKRSREAIAGGRPAAIGPSATVVVGDVGTLAGARALGDALAATVEKGATLVHNAGLWPVKRVVQADGFESSFVVNHLGPLVMQEALFARKLVDRVFVVGAGIMKIGRFDANRTPRGDDFSWFRTYATTKLCFAIAMRDVAEAHPELDVLVLHPGVVRTDLGAVNGFWNKLIDLAKRRFEDPEVCAARLARILARDRWSPPRDAHWLELEDDKPWPNVADDAAVRRAVRETTARLVPRAKAESAGESVGDAAPSH